MRDNWRTLRLSYYMQDIVSTLLTAIVIYIVPIVAALGIAWYLLSGRYWWQWMLTVTASFVAALAVSVLISQTASFLGYCTTSGAVQYSCTPSFLDFFYSITAILAVSSLIGLPFLLLGLGVLCASITVIYFFRVEQGGTGRDRTFLKIANIAILALLLLSVLSLFI